MSQGPSSSTDEFLARIRARKLAAKRRRRRMLVFGGIGAAVCAAAVTVTLLITMNSAPASPPDVAAPLPTASAPSLIPSPLPAQPPSSPEPAPTAARAALAQLAAVAPHSGNSIARYYRESFGQAWADVDRNGCDTRNDILRRDLDDLVIKPGTNGCKVLGGILQDLYTGRTVQFVSGGETSRLVQIDHVVPLAWAWRHGAETWSAAEREEFANDPANLIATTEEANQEKGASGPSEWLPPDRASHCEYAARFTAVLADWRLGVDDADRAALRDVLEGCG